MSNPRLHSQLVPNQLYAEDWGASGGQLAFTYNEATRQVRRRGQRRGKCGEVWGLGRGKVDLGVGWGGQVPRGKGAPAECGSVRG